MRKLAPGASLRLVLTVGLVLVAVALVLMHGLTLTRAGRRCCPA